MSAEKIDLNWIHDYVQVHFLQAGKKYLNEKVEAGAVPFNLAALKSKAATFENFIHIYLNNKNEPTTGRAFQDKIRKIATPHPIGNNTAGQGVVFDIMAKVFVAKIRHESYGKEDENEARKVEQFKKEVILGLTELGMAHTKIAKIYKAETFDAMFDALIAQFLSQGIRTEVINKPAQKQSNDLGIKYLAKKGEKSLTWHNGVDMDGDKESSMVDSFGEGIRGKNIFDIFKHSKALNKPPYKYQPRISCAPKKGVLSLIEQLEQIKGVNSVESFSDIIGEKFNSNYKLFEKSFKNMTYSPVREGSELPVNFPMNAILAITAPAFLPSQGMVLSDFPAEHGEKLLARLLFVKKAVGKYLANAEKVQQPIDQTFMPLCEEKESIENFQTTLKAFYTSVLDQLGGDDEKNRAILDLLTAEFEGKKFFSVGSFFGPSDLTKNMGQTSIIELTRNYILSELEFRDFKEKVKEKIGGELYDSTFADVNYMQEYGKGTSPRRGGNYVLFSIPRTIQGLQMASMSSVIQKAYEKGQELCDLSTKELSSLLEDIKAIEPLINPAAAAHKSFFREVPNGEAKGLIVAELDELAKNLNYEPARKYLQNNQGCRGGATAKDTATEENTRAIESVAKNCYGGLLTACGFPLNPQNEIPDFDLKKFIKLPFGMQIFMAELLQMLSIDYDRANLLGFSDGTISKVQEYVANVAEFFAEKLEIQFQKDFDKTKEGRVAFVNAAIDKVLNSGILKDDFLEKRLELFKCQIASVSVITGNLTSSIQAMLGSHSYARLVEDLKETGDKGRAEVITRNKKVIEEHFAPISSILNDISNFQLPVISAVAPVHQAAKDGKKVELWQGVVQQRAAFDDATILTANSYGRNTHVRDASLAGYAAVKHL
ncbi:MAG: hypothetical protein K0R98_533 [Rickettsiaceae bacterium]|jgi:hypothetical protein|nr:hypothetical protein [Rickettsiaceae bacterium]